MVLLHNFSKEEDFDFFYCKKCNLYMNSEIRDAHNFGHEEEEDFEIYQNGK